MIQSSFGKRLFWLFLLFALLPSLIIVAWGYYLSTELTEVTNRNRPDFTLQLIEYFNKQQDRELAALAYDFSTSAESFFTLAISPNDVNQFDGKQILSEQAIGRLRNSLESRSSGLIHVDCILIQYHYVKVTADSGLLYGLICPPEYTSILDSLQYDLTQSRSEQHLWQEYSFFLFLLFLSVFIVMTFAAYRLSSKIASHLAEPLTELANATELIAQGSFDQRVPDRGSGEIQQLITNFNDMAATLRQTTERLTQAERVAAWRHLARRFAHELKNPLQPITVSLYRIEKFLDKIDLEDTPRDAIRATREELAHLTELADRFSTLAKLPPPDLATYDIGHILESIIAVFSDRLSNYKFSKTFPQQPAYALIDATYFREAIQNVIINAMDATEDGKKIELSLSSSASEICIEVKDQGSGMDEATIRSARMPYFTTKQKGDGIGLAVVEKTVAEMNGHLSINSVTGKGTTVRISLPRVDNQ